ncbi:MAG: UDP-3-O-(3-hydroxymyristoyl)glucosamine N-acyltransferase [Fuerstiella sp.]
MASTPAVQLTAGEIAALLDARIIGDDSLKVSGVAFIEQASETDLVFVGCDKNLKRAAATKARLIIAPRSAVGNLAPFPDRTFILVDEPEAAFLQMAVRLVPPRRRSDVGISPHAIVAESAIIGRKTNIHPLAVIGEDVRIGDHCCIGPGVVIGDGCEIGDHVTIDANTVLYPDVVLGNRISIKACTVIGGQGFGYRTVNGRHELLPHVGIVRIADDVEIGACSTIDRAKMGETFVDTGTRIDNQVMIAHNCRLGRHNLIVAQTGIAGSTTTGAYVVCAGQAGIADHVHLGDGAVIGAKTGVHRDMPGGKAYLGIPARDASLHAREQMSLKRLPEMRSTVKQLEKQVARLEQQLASLMGRVETDQLLSDDQKTREAA